MAAGGIGAARNLAGLQEQGVTHVLNVSPVVPCFHRKALRYKTVTVYDDPDSNIAQYFSDTNKYIHKVGIVSVSVCSSLPTLPVGCVVSGPLLKGSSALRNAR